jgi:hypothetical protein
MSRLITCGYLLPLMRGRRYVPARPKRISGHQAAMAGGSWLRLPIASKRLEVDQ